MPIESSADQAAFLDDFGEAMTFTISGSPTAVTGIWDESFIAIDLQSGMEVSSVRPSALVLSSAIAGLNQNDPATIRSTAYRVSEVQKQTDGVFSVVLLHRT